VCRNQGMFPHDRELCPIPNGARIAERLLACARLCRQIAAANVDADMALEFVRLADECTRTAAQVDSHAGGARLM